MRTITGSATFKIVLSRLTMRRLTQSTARMNRRSLTGRPVGASDISERRPSFGDSGCGVPSGSGPETEVLIEGRTILAGGRSAAYTPASLLACHDSRWHRLSVPGE